MIKVRIKKENDIIESIHCKGHAMYDDYGKDIVCAAVSVTILNCFNSIEEFTDDFVSSSTENGITHLELKDNISSDTELLINSMILGLNQIKSNYGKKYLKISVKEV